jgi:serine/threonine-protein kinase
MERRTIERYELCDRIASGGMGSVHLGHLHGSAGFRRIVAIKRMHPELTSDPDFVRAFIEEAKLAARIRHPNVVPILDALKDQAGEYFLILEYVHGEALHKLLKSSGRSPVHVVCAVACGILEGLHAAHSAVDERGAPLEIVHRDVSPQNVMVGTDGHARILDFGVATATRRARGPAMEQRGKVGYMAPEQIVSGEVSPRSDVYSAAVILWEALTGFRLFSKENTLEEILDSRIVRPSLINKSVPRALDDVVMKGLERNPALRWSSAREMSLRVEQAVEPASERTVGDWVNFHAGELLRERSTQIAMIERSIGGTTNVELDAPPPMFGEFDGVIVSETRSVPDFSPNAVLFYPNEMDPKSEKVAVTAKRVTEPTLDLVGTTAVELGPPPPQRRRTPALPIVIGTAGLLTMLLLVSAMNRPEEPVLAALPPVELVQEVKEIDEPKEVELEPIALRLDRVKIAPKKKHKKRVAKPKPNPCDPPFWIDADGFRRLKPGCD